MRCKSCNKPFTPALTNRHGKLVFAPLCNSCKGKYHQGYSNTHDHVHGLEDEPLVMVAKTGVLRTETY